MTMDLISVIVPVYKAEPYLRRCVDSILAQTYTNLEVILVDDGSPDNCGVICDEYAEKDKRVKVIHQANAGVSAARNAGLRIAKGEYISFVDADDTIDADMCEILLQIARKEDADIVECNYRRDLSVQGGTGRVSTYYGLDAVVRLFTADGYPDGFNVSPYAKLIRREATCENGFLEGCSMAEDMLYVVELFCKASKVVKLDRRLYTYWITPHSATNQEYRINKADEVNAAYQAMMVMQGTGNVLVAEIGTRRYVDMLLMHWYRCYSLGSEGARKAKELRKKLMDTYEAVKEYLTRQQIWKCRLLMRTPVFYWCAHKIFSERKAND